MAATFDLYRNVEVAIRHPNVGPLAIGVGALGLGIDLKLGEPGLQGEQDRVAARGRAIDWLGKFDRLGLMVVRRIEDESLLAEPSRQVRFRLRPAHFSVRKTLWPPRGHGLAAAWVGFTTRAKGLDLAFVEHSFHQGTVATIHWCIPSIVPRKSRSG